VGSDGRFLPASPEPRRSEIRKPMWTWPRCDQCLSGPILSAGKIRLRTVFWPGGHGPAADFLSAGVSLHRADRLGCSLPCVEQVLPPAMAHPGFRPGFAAGVHCSAAPTPLRSFCFATVEADPPCSRIAGFRGVHGERLIPLVLEALIQWRNIAKGWPTPGPFRGSGW